MVFFMKHLVFLNHYPVFSFLFFLFVAVFLLGQHEYDHLDGKVYIDRLSPEEKEKVSTV